MSRRVQVLIGVGLAALLLWLFLRGTDLAVIGAELRRADYRLVLIATLLTLFANVQRAWRWRHLLMPIKDVGVGSLTSAIFIGWAFTALLGGRLGEIARPVLIGRREGISKTAAFATVVLERLFDLFSVLVILVVYLLFFPLPSGLDVEGASIISGMRVSGLAVLAGLVVVVSFLVGSQLMPDRTDALLRRMTGWLPGGLGDRVLPLARSFLSGFAGMRDPKLLVAIVSHSALLWLNILVTYYLLFFAFDIELPFYAVMPLIVIVVIGVMVPTPAAVGGFHLATELALVTLWGVAQEPAVGYAIVCHAMVFVPVTLIGLALLSREGMSMRGIEQLEEDNGE